MLSLGREFWDVEDTSNKGQKKMMSLENKMALKIVEKIMVSGMKEPFHIRNIKVLVY